MQKIKINKNKIKIIIIIMFFSLPLILLGIYSGTDNISYYGSEFNLLYLLYFVILSYFIIKYLLKMKNKFFIIFVFYKLPISVFLLYLLFNRYSGGDFEIYYKLPISIFKDWNLFYEAILPSKFIHLFFRLFPISLLGLSFLYALISYIGYILVYKVIRKNLLAKEEKWVIFYMFFLSPTIVLQTNYIGKDGLVIFLIGVIFTLLEKSKMGWSKFLGIGFLIYVIFSIRAYQGIIMVLVFILYSFLKKYKGKIIFFTLFFGTLISKFIVPKIAEILYPRYSGMNLTEILERAYLGGNLMLSSFAWPFNFLQIFRPFPWEINNLYFLIVSLELSVIFLIIIYVFINNIKNIKFNFDNKIFKFSFIYVFVNVYIFSFNPNMGDLTRRRIYFMPILITLFYIWEIKERKQQYE